jgi:hypothetical protein
MSHTTPHSSTHTHPLKQAEQQAHKFQTSSSLDNTSGKHGPMTTDKNKGILDQDSSSSPRVQLPHRHHGLIQQRTVLLSDKNPPTLHVYRHLVEDVSWVTNHLTLNS